MIRRRPDLLALAVALLGTLAVAGAFLADLMISRGSELAAAIRRKKAEELFLTCLVQDIGVLALDAADEVLYAELDETPATHGALIRREMEHLGTDHAAVGASILWFSAGKNPASRPSAVDQIRAPAVAVVRRNR